MIDLSQAGMDGLRMTTKMIAEQAIARGWKVHLYYKGSSQLKIERLDGKVLELYSASPPTASYIAANRSNDKYFTNLYLADNGLPVPETILVSQNDQESIESAGERFFSSKRGCVVKPLDAGHGNGITVAIYSKEKLKAAVNTASEFSKKIIIQEYFSSPVDIRITCINYRFAAALKRIPARVKGDGSHAVSELIDSENSSGRRGQGYVSDLNVINKAAAEVFLGESINGVPRVGEWVQVVGTANVGTGGETSDITEMVPDWLKSLAEKAATSMQLPVCGVDFLLAIDPKPESTVQILSPVIIELNQCPSLFIHEVPIHGSPQPVVAKFLDYLETI